MSPKIDRLEVVNTRIDPVIRRGLTRGKEREEELVAEESMAHQKFPNQ